MIQCVIMTQFTAGEEVCSQLNLKVKLNLADTLLTKLTTTVELSELEL